MEGKGIFRITGEDTECLLDKNVYSYCIDADNNKLYYSGLGDGIIYEYDLGSGKSESIYESDNDTGYFYITFSLNYICLFDYLLYLLKCPQSLIYRLYGHFAFVVNLTYLGLSSYIFAIKRG